jgi:peptide-methionine (S)-S-oxide reductase
MINKAAFAAGCFWHVQEAFDKIPGVLKTKVGFMGGAIASPTYNQVCSGKTGHAETVELEFDDQKVTYEQLLSHFFTLHDPTSVDRQGPDIGNQYRSAIFYYNEAQHQQAKEMISQLNEKHRYNKPIVTQVAPAGDFYSAEDYHQKYFAKQCGFPRK